MKLSMSSLQSVHKRIKDEITVNQDEIVAHSLAARVFYASSTPESEFGYDCFINMNFHREQVRKLKESNKKLAQTSLEIKKTLRSK